MKEQLITFETAKLAKKKGFDKILCYNAYVRKGELVLDIKNEYDMGIYTNQSVSLLAPTQSLLQKWLREKHKINIGITYFDKGFLFSIAILPHRGFSYKVRYSSTYEEALEKALQEALNLVEFSK